MRSGKLSDTADRVSEMRPLTLRVVAALALMIALVGCATNPGDPGPSVSIRRSACYGRCPEYQFTLYSNGQYAWEGRAHVAVNGAARGRMGEGVYTAAMRLLTDARYLEFRDDYGNGPECEQGWETDHSTVTIVVTDPAHPKTISHYTGCIGFKRQEALMQLEDNLDEVFKTRRFTG
jgi:hypothetical protein